MCHRVFLYGIKMRNMANYVSLLSMCTFTYLLARHRRTPTFKMWHIAVNRSRLVKKHILLHDYWLYLRGR